MRAARPISRISLSLALILAVTSTSMAQIASEEISFFTADHVELAGAFYGSERSKSAPCVMLLHALNGSRKQAGWDGLARHLQKQGYAVLTFDFRGHGLSKNVSPEFWQTPMSRSLKAMPGAPANSIHVEQFTRPCHYASLVNDVRAARRVLELKCLDGQCDARQMFVVGADSGASLGLLWIDAEWQRWRVAKDSSGRPTKQGPEALDIAGAVWLSFSANWPGRFTAPVENWLVSPASERTPMGFLYGAAETRSKAQSVSAHEKLSKSAKDSLHSMTTILAIPDSTRTGSDMLAEEGDRIHVMIGTYLDNVLKDRRRPVRTPPDLETLPPIFNPDAYGFR